MDRITNPTGPGDPPRIRDTEISVWDVYRDLAFHGIAEDKVLQNHPKLEPEDLNAVREFVATSIKSRTHDEFTGRPILRKEQLRHEAVYKGRCRNGSIARWNSDEQCFYYWREKVGRIYIQTIRFPTDETERG